MPLESEVEPRDGGVGGGATDPGSGPGDEKDALYATLVVDTAVAGIDVASITPAPWCVDTNLGVVWWKSQLLQGVNFSFDVGLECRKHGGARATLSVIKVIAPLSPGQPETTECSTSTTTVYFGYPCKGRGKLS